ncbi:MAG: multiple resistance and pH regulation protein F [Candidatus Omnitrophica bacterium]|nr:multiple resistance and pH regulation protein F [Candidatus Omnitrophota bacterium]MCB9720158.1 multiple resistance and pH regulation protein F [Candidatus Omnitrophota bacterium]
MGTVYLISAVVILMTLIAGLSRLYIGPTRADRMLAAQLGGTAGVAIFALLANAFGQSFLYDLALVLAILAAVSTIAFARLTWHKPLTGKEDADDSD